MMGTKREAKAKNIDNEIMTELECSQDAVRQACVVRTPGCPMDPGKRFL